MPLLKALNVTKTFIKLNEHLKILNDINLDLNYGEIVALIGPSGSGKSTLLNILGTLDVDYLGTLKIDNVIIDKKSDLGTFRCKKIGFIFQFHHLLPEFTVLENVAIPLMIANKYHNLPNNEVNKIKELLKFIGLEDRLNHYPNEISGGERQRVAAVRAMANNPSFILADEPTGNLDRDNTGKMLKLMADFKLKYNQSFIIATHDKAVLNIADRVLHLKNGKIIKD